MAKYHSDNKTMSKDAKQSRKLPMAIVRQVAAGAQHDDRTVDGCKKKAPDVVATKRDFTGGAWRWEVPLDEACRSPRRHRRA